MSDPRFARLKSDPRFRRPKREKSKVVVDERFESVLGSKSKKDKKGKGRVDKYGRSLSDTHEEDKLRRLYRAKDEEAAEEPKVLARPDYARGAVLLESSDEEDEDVKPEEDDSDFEGVVTLGRDVSKPISALEEEAEIDLDEDTYAELDAQAAAYAKEAPEFREDVHRTRRLAVVNLDWDYVRASHLYRIVSSLVSPTASALASSSATSDPLPIGKGKRSVTHVVRGRVLSVRVYPSQFGKERMTREEKEGPPPEVFKNRDLDPEEVNERTVFDTGDGDDYDEDALRKYQLERLRYYYAIVECDTVEAASHIFSELEGTELERSANVFDLSFVPDDMTFDEEFRDEATEDSNATYKPVEFVTEALRHSKVKLTWDEDDPERVQITRRGLSRKEIEENDFRAYIASSESSEDEDEGPDTSRKAQNRDKLRALLLGGNEDALPEGWNADEDGKDFDMEITFTPGLSNANDQGETTLDKYKRKMKEKKTKRKEDLVAKQGGEKGEEKRKIKDEFFAEGSDDEDEDAEDAKKPLKNIGKIARNSEKKASSKPERHETTAQELELLAASDKLEEEPKHFDMKAVVRAEKAKGRKKGKKQKHGEPEDVLQEDFKIDVKDERFKAVHEDHTFAIDPSNPHFKKTKSMAALLEERSKQRNRRPHEAAERAASRTEQANSSRDLKSLVESVKRKSTTTDSAAAGKRRKL